MLIASSNANHAIKQISSQIKNKKCLAPAKAESIKTYKKNLSKATQLLKNAANNANARHCKLPKIVLNKMPQIPKLCLPTFVTGQTCRTCLLKDELYYCDCTMSLDIATCRPVLCTQECVIDCGKCASGLRLQRLGYYTG